MDDLLFVSYMDESATAELIALILYIFYMFGLSVNTTKSTLQPCLELDYLGYTLHA